MNIKSRKYLSWLAALGAGFGIATAASAVTKPLAVWNADFPTSGNSQRGTCTLYLNGNTSDGEKVTISGDSSAHGLGVALSQTTRTIMAVAGISGVQSATTTNPRIFASVDVANQSDCRINMGLPSESLNLYGYTSSISGDSYSSTIAWPSDGGKHYFGFQYDAMYGTTYYGTMGFVNGSLSAGTYYQKAGLVYKDDYAEAIYIGGIYKNGWNLADAEVSYLVVLDSSDCEDVKYWSQLAITSVETVASDATSFTGGTGVGVNLNGGTITVTQGQTAQAMFVQDDTTLEVPLAANALAITKPLYVADGKTLTVKLSGTISASGTTTVVAAGNIFGDVVVDSSAIDDTNYVVTTTVGTSAISITCRRKVIWNGGENGDWGTASNWLLGDNTVPSAAPSDTTKNGGDHVIFNKSATVSIGNRKAEVSRITLNADVTFVGRSLAQGNGLFFDEMDGDGKLTLNGVWVATIAEGNGRTVTIRNDVCIASDSYFNGASLVNHIYGNLTGSGNLAYHLKGGEAAHLWLHGDNSGYSGTLSVVRDGGAYSRIDLDGAQASSANAVWSFECYAGSGIDSQNTTYVVKSTDTYYFGGITGGFHVNGYDAHIEIGARENYASTFNYDTRANRQYGYITKVGSNTLTLNGTPYYVTLKGGTTTLGASFNYGSYNSRSTTLVFEGSGASLIVSPKTENDVTTYPDVSEYIKNSSAPVAFDTAGNDFTWATALAASNVGGLTKKGAGTLTLTKIPQYSGATRVEEGTLVVPLGTQLGDVYVAEGATLTFDLANTTMTGALATFTSKTGDGEVKLINYPEGASIKKAGSTFMVVSGARTLTWAGPTDDDYSWATASNWTVGGEAATSAPTAVDDVVFETAAPGVVLTAAAEALSVTAPDGLTLATAYDLIVYDDFTVTGAFVKSGKGTLAVEGTLSATGGATITGGAVEGDIDSETAVTFAPVALSSDNYTASYGAKLTLDESRTFSNFGGSGTIVSSADQTYSASSDATFAGAISGNGGFTKTGAGTLTLIGNQTFAGDVTVSEGGLKLGTIEDIADIRYNLDASADDAFTTDEDGNITAWKSTVNSASYSFDHSAGGYIMADETTMMGSRRAASFQPDYSDVVQVGYACKASNWSNDKSQTILIAYNADSGIDINSYLWGQGNSDNRKIQYRYSNHNWYWPGDKNRGGFYVNGAYGSGVGVGQNRLLVSVDTGVMQAGSSSYKDTVGAGAKGFKGVIGQVTAFKRVLTMEEKQAAEAYLMAKWGINNATYAALPATADVTVAAGATLDLGGQTVTVASLNLSGTIQNGTLVVTSNNLTIAPATAAITATIMVSGYDSSMTAPAGFSFTGNGDGTATLVDNRATVTLTWTATESGGNWSDASNWDLGVAPGSGNAVVFPSGEYTVYIDTATAACAGMAVNGTVEFAQTGKALDVHNVLKLYSAVTGSGIVKLHHVGVENQSGAAIAFSPALVIEAPEADPASDSWFNTAAFEFGGNVSVEAGGNFVVYAAAPSFSGNLTISDGGIFTARGGKPVFGAVTVTLGEGAYMGDWADKGFTFNGTTVVGSGTGAYLWAGNGGANSPIDGTGVTFQGAVTINNDYTNTKNYFDTTISATTVSMASGASITMKTENLSIASAPAATTANHEIVVSTDSTAGTTTYADVDNSTSTWKSTVSAGSWKDAANWENGVVPATYTDVVFPAGKYTVYVTSDAWDSAAGRDVCKGMTVNGEVTLRESNNGWNYLSLHGNISGTGTLKLTWTGLENHSGSEMTIGCAVEVVNVDSHDSYLNQIAGNGYRFTGDVTLHGWFQCWENVVFAGTLTIDTASALTIGNDDTLTIANLVVTPGTAAQITGGASTAITGTVTLQGTGSTLTVPAGADVSGATFTTSVSGYKVSLDGNVYRVVVDTTVAPNATSIEYATEAEATTAAAGYKVALTKEQTEQGLQASYYTTAVVPGATAGTYVVTAKLSDDVMPEVDEGVTVTTTTVTLPVTNLKPGLCYRIVYGEAAGVMTGAGEWSDYYVENGDAPVLQAALPASGVLYYAIEAADTK